MIPRILLRVPTLVATLILAGLACGNETTPTSEARPAASSPAFPAKSPPAAATPSKGLPAIPPHPRVPSTPALEAPLPPLRFSGSSTIYVLRRIAGESGVHFGVDLLEIGQPPETASFGQRFVDLDLDQGTVREALQQLYAKLGGFHYIGMGDGIYIKEWGFIPNDPVALQKRMPAKRYAGNFTNLHSWFFRLAGMVVRAEKAPGTPVWKKVDFETTEPMSVAEFMMRYGQEAQSSWLLRRNRPRAGMQQKPEFAISDIQLLPTNTDGGQPSGVFNRTSVLATLVDISELTGTPICIVDWSHGPGIPLPSIGGAMGPHGNNSPVQEQLPKLLEQYPGTVPFRWEERDGVILVHSTRYDFNVAMAGSIMAERLKGGAFSGSLGELARWINQNGQGPSKGDLLAGEIFANDPVASLEIKDGATIEEVLLAFAAETGTGWTFSRRLTASGTEVADPDGSASDGAFLLPLEFWHRNGRQGLVARRNSSAAAVSGAAPPTNGSGSP